MSRVYGISMSRCTLLFACVLISGCAALQSQGQINNADQPPSTSTWKVEVEGEFSTEIIGGDIATTDNHVVLIGELSESPRALNPDETETWLLEYRDFLQGESRESLAPSDLSGRAITLRRFPGEQVLEIDGGEHLIGFNADDVQAIERQRLGDVFDLLLAIVNPAAPALNPGEVRLKMIRWPFSAERGRNLRSYANVTWAYEASEEGLIKMSYQGTISGQGRDSNWDSSIAVSGEASGEVWLDEVTGEVRGHDFDWLRILQYRFSNSDVRISQHQHFTGGAQWLE